MAAGITILPFPGEGEINVANLGGGTAGRDGGSVGHETFRALEGTWGELGWALVSGKYGRLWSRQQLEIGSERGSGFRGGQHAGIQAINHDGGAAAAEIVPIQAVRSQRSDLSGYGTEQGDADPD